MPLLLLSLPLLLALLPVVVERVRLLLLSLLLLLLLLLLPGSVVPKVLAAEPLHFLAAASEFDRRTLVLLDQPLPHPVRGGRTLMLLRLLKVDAAGAEEGLEVFVGTEGAWEKAESLSNNERIFISHMWSNQCIVSLTCSLALP